MPRVLLIDDDREQLDVRALVISHYQHIVDTASNPADAKRAFEANHPDCIAMDLRLPTVDDGLDLIRTFRAAPAFAGKIIVLSGFPQDLKDRPEAAMVDIVLTKPTRSEILLACIEG